MDRNRNEFNRLEWNRMESKVNETEWTGIEGTDRN